MTGAAHDLNLLLPLRALLEEVNVTRAAERVNMGQSSMSAALSRLREEFDDELLVRIGREYELTPLARRLLPQVQTALPLLERALTGDPLFDPSTADRTFRLMATDYVALRLQPAIADVLAGAPRIHLDVVPLPERPMESERDLFNNDFVTAIGGIGVEGDSAELLTDDFVCLVDQGNPALRQGALSMEDFLALPQAVAQFGRYHYTPADRAMRERGISRRDPRVTTASYLPLPTIVAGTDLVAVVPRGLAERLGPRTGTVGVEPPFGRVEMNIRLWWHESHNNDPLHVWFRTRLLESWRRGMPG